MIAILSPAKSLDFEYNPGINATTTPIFKNDADELIEVLKTKSKAGMKKLMNLSDQLAELNVERCRIWKKRPGENDVRPAVFAFTGDVYRGLDIRSKKQNEIEYAQDHIRILSGLYGVLKPLDNIQPYRLEAGTKLKTKAGKNLYEYWSDKLTDHLNEELSRSGSKVLINLASNEYFKLVNAKKLEADIVTPVFKDYKNGKFKVISFYAKWARGAMAAYMMENRVSALDQLRAFESEGYALNNRLTEGKELIFTRGGE